MSPATAPATGAVPLIGFGHVRHTRLRPRRHRFVYPTFFLMLPMRTLQRQPDAAGVLAWNRPGLLGFRDSDHGDGRSAAQGGALAWLETVLQAEGIGDADGEIWLQCYPRVLGYSFKPVSFWYCHRRDGSLRAIVAEVNNTFGERHAYVLDHPAYGCELQASKVFHVSPFCPVEGGYRFEFQRRGVEGLDAVSVRVDYDDAQGPLVLTGMGGRLQPLTAAARRHALWRYPCMTLAVTARIHWHALRLWLKRVPFYRKPPPPLQPVTRSTLHR
ncbi:DUF1365 domain-containing protein [Comamonas aquatica]|uniref:DUF1365 domain-containing protein n=1 Tax=Comamonas aquatica TaxID=225991 RepID=UPI002448F374|nr:DUF1365 domain-containing protein [Comamonas aquatica]MDH0202671.1 DUF1365 domain-containing protein [Comamonas aquatica]MDH1447773.1 DUF1365 domain-containing protein [Comamonas aquatica]